MRKAVLNELRTGMELKKQMERRREIEAATQAQEKANHKEIKGLGRCVAVIPSWDYFRMKQKYGNEVASDEFLKYYQKKFPHLAPCKI